jgi:hypothetical protein
MSAVSAHRSINRNPAPILCLDGRGGGGGGAFLDSRFMCLRGRRREGGLVVR